MIQIAVTLLFTGAALIALASLLDSAVRIPRLIRGLQAERERLRNATPYTGPIFNRHGREFLK